MPLQFPFPLWGRKQHCFDAAGRETRNLCLAVNASAVSLCRCNVLFATSTSFLAGRCVTALLSREALTHGDRRSQQYMLTGPPHMASIGAEGGGAPPAPANLIWYSIHVPVRTRGQKGDPWKQEWG